MRRRVESDHPHKLFDLSFLRRETIRQVMLEADEAPELADAAFSTFFAARQQVTLFEDAEPALKLLSAKYPLISLSNGNADILQVGIAAWFSGTVSASQAGCAKPDPKIFHLAADVAGVKPENILHVGDDARLDAQAARAAGMQAVWLNRDKKSWDFDEPRPLTVTSLKELVQLLKGEEYGSL